MGWDGRDPSSDPIFFAQGSEFITCISWNRTMVDTIFIGCSFCMSWRGYFNYKFAVRITIFMFRIVIPHVVLSFTWHPRCLRIELIGLST